MRAQRSRPRVPSGAAYLVAGVIVMLLGAFLIIIREPSASTATIDDPVVITNYAASFTVDDAGDLSAVETIDARFPDGRHGIYRYWDAADPADPSARYPVTVVSIERDGQPEPVELSKTGTVTVAKIGDKDVILPSGEHRYVLVYSVPGVLRPVRDIPAAGATTAGARDGSERSVFAWWVLASNWELRVISSQVTVTLPDPITAAACRAPGSACVIRGAGTRTLTITAPAQPARSGIELAAYSSATPSSTEAVPWPAKDDAYYGTVAWAPWAAIALAALSLLGGAAWSRAARESTPGAPVQYAPPEGLGPVQCVYLVTETVGDHALTASVMHLAQRGLVTLEGEGAGWSVRHAGERSGWAAIDPVTRTAAHGLRVESPGGSFHASATESAGAKIRSTISAIEKAADTWALDGLWTRTHHVIWGRVAAVLSMAVGLVVGIVAPALYGLPFAMFALGAAGLFATGTGRRRTAQAREQWSRAAGFQRLLTTDSAEARFDFAARGDLWIAYLPYAVAFGAADAWSERYRAATGHEPPSPTWWPAYWASTSHGFAGSGGIGAFDAAVASSVAAYTAAHSGSSGGGGGGGGGGSW